MSTSFLLPQPAIIVAAAKSTLHLAHVEIRDFIIVLMLVVHAALCASNQRRSTCRFTWHTLANIPLDNIWGLYLQGQYQSATSNT